MNNLRNVFLSLLILGALGSCGVPTYMEVRSGLEPENQDEAVRFRTVYYFRVINTCQNKNAGSRIQSDSLYRFRMTGKAGALGNTVHFESGILHKDQIDPFGKKIVFNPYAQNYANVTNDEITTLQSSIDSLDKRITSVEKSKDQAATGKPSNGNCQDGSSLTQSFQIMGPQGVATFDQDYRLIMAMSSESKSLISMMKETSGRILGRGENKAEKMLSLIKEQLNTSQAGNTLAVAKQSSGSNQNQKIETDLVNIIKAFDANCDWDTANKQCKGAQ